MITDASSPFRPIEGIEGAVIDRYHRGGDGIRGVDGHHVIQDSLFPEFERTFGALLKRAERLGVEPPTYEVVAVVESYEWWLSRRNPNPVRDEDGNAIPDPYAHVNGASGLRPFADDRADPDQRVWAVGSYPSFLIRTNTPPVQFDGWTFVASLRPVVLDEDFGGRATFVTALIPGYEGDLPRRYLPGNEESVDPSHCDHCGKRRTRANTYVLAHKDGETKQVGASCLRDFLHGQSADSLAKYFASLDGFKSWGESDDDEGQSRGSREDDSLGTGAYIALASRVIRGLGWKSKSASNNGPYVAPTARDIEDQIDIRRGGVRARDLIAMGVVELEVEDSDLALAASARRWASSLRGEGTFDANLRVASQSARATSAVSGLLAYLPVAYGKWIGEEAKRKLAREAAPPSAPQGKVGDRIERTLTVVSLKGFESEWGVSILVKLVDGEGNAYAWFTSSAVPQIGQTAAVRGTVKAHKEYKGRWETNLTRVAPLKGHAWDLVDNVWELVP